MIHSGLFLEWTWEELRQTDSGIRKLLTMYNALHPIDYRDRLNETGKEGRRGLAIRADSMDLSILELVDYIKKSKNDKFNLCPSPGDPINVY